MLTLPTDLQDRIFKTRAAAFKIDPGVLEEVHAKIHVGLDRLSTGSAPAF